MPEPAFRAAIETGKKRGEATAAVKALVQGQREQKRAEVRERLDEVAARHAEEPTGVYDVLVVDPPWPIENTDLKWFDVGKTRLAARVRKPLDRYGKLATSRFMPGVTIRSDRANGVETEIDKIRAGLGDFMFYGIVSEDYLYVAHWVVLDLARFREDEPAAPFTEKRNSDKSPSSFRAYPSTRLGPRTVVAVFNWPLAEHQRTHAREIKVVPSLPRRDSRAVKDWRLKARAAETRSGQGELFA